MEDWKFCNGELEELDGYCSDYVCPKCGSTSGLVNVIGKCAMRIKQDEDYSNVKYEDYMH